MGEGSAAHGARAKPFSIRRLSTRGTPRGLFGSEQVESAPAYGSTTWWIPQVQGPTKVRIVLDDEIVSCAGFLAFGVSQQVDWGMYIERLPDGGKGPSSVDADGCFVPAIPRITAEFRKPRITSKWWTDALWPYRSASFCGVLYAHPLAMQPTQTGLGICYPSTPEISSDGLEYIYPYEEDLLVGIVSLRDASLKVADYSDWTATFNWEAPETRLVAIAGRGMPYVHFERRSEAAVRVIFGDGAQVSAHDGGVLTALVRGRHYALFGPNGCRWECSGPREWTSDLDGKLYWSVAALPDGRTDTLAEFRRHAHVVTIDTQVAWAYEQSSSSVRTELTWQCEAREGEETIPLVALYPHQWKYCEIDSAINCFASPRGSMKLVRTNQLTVRLPSPGLLPVMPTPDTIDVEGVRQLIAAVGRDEQTPLLPTPVHGATEDDAYWSGKALGRLAELARLADAVGMPEERNRFLDKIKDKFALYFNGREKPCFYYDETWNSLIFYPSGSHGLDTALNDHHYTYGYFLNAIGTLVHFDPHWWRAGTNATMVRAIIADVANDDRSDSHFPFMRHFDVYAGHSWGSGAAADIHSLNAEAVGEGINFAQSLALLGCETGDTALRDLGLWLAANEIVAAELYWFNSDRDVFPPHFPWAVAGIVCSDGARYGTWWSTIHEQIYAITLIPIRTGSLYLGRRANDARRRHGSMLQLTGGQLRRWFDIHCMHQAMHDAPAALARYGAQSGERPEWGTSAALTYHWLHALNALGAPQTTSADTPCYHVFRKEGVTTYVAYNPGTAPIRVRFTDGFEFSVSPGTLETQITCRTAPASKRRSFSKKRVAGKSEAC